MRIAAVLYGTRANGPGLRTAVWLQGCPLGPAGECPGCQNPLLWDAHGGREIEPWRLWHEVLTGMAPATAGITISGGEPLAQAADLWRFLTWAHGSRKDLSIGLFTGYYADELERIKIWPAIRHHLDWALMGRWDRTKPAVSGFGPSTNQVLKIWRRYQPEDFVRMVEFSIGDGGLTQVTGFPGRQA